MKKKLENVLFEKHPFTINLFIILIVGLPWLFAFWPGTLVYDSCGQLLQYFGVAKLTGHHPLPVTMTMGLLMDAGRYFFQSDNVGIFLYTGIQFLAQCLVSSYTFVVYKHIKAPKWIRWVTLLFYTFFPLLPNWGICYGKDTGYYISFLLFTLVLIEMFLNNSCIQRKHWILWIISLLGLICFRNDGRYVAVISLLVLFIFKKDWRRLCATGIGVVVSFIFLVEGVYMPRYNIPSGAIREALSVPLMQTANYLDNCQENVTEDEASVLLSVFNVDTLEEIALSYDEEISDNVKGLFLENPTPKELMAYLKVWWQQLLKHPELYIETFIKHCDGYFNPTERCYEDIIGYYGILDGQSRKDDYLNIYFAEETTDFRDRLKKMSYSLYKMPLLGLLYRPAVHTLILLGCITYLFTKHRKRYICVLIPGVLILLVCMVSPVDGSVRYYLPVMTSIPAYIAFCSAKNSQA